MAEERVKREKELSEFRAELERANQARLTELKTNFEIFRDTYLKEHNDKLASYRLAIDVVAEYLSEITNLKAEGPLDIEAYKRFNRGRIRAHGYLGIVAPQDVMDAYDNLVDGIFSVLDRKPTRFTDDDWKRLRVKAYSLMNAIRADVGIDKTQIVYKGPR